VDWADLRLVEEKGFSIQATLYPGSFRSSPRVTHVKVGHKVLEVGREEVSLACFASRVQVGANLNLCEQVLPFQVQKRKILPRVTR
jgi:hypothetical protein